MVDNIIVCMKIIESIIIELGKMAELKEGDENTTENLLSEFELVSKKNTKTLVWKYFGLRWTQMVSLSRWKHDYATIL